MDSERDVRAQLQRAGQDHLLRFYADLAPEARAALLAELASLEADALREHCQRAAAAGALAPGPLPDLAARLQPLPPERVGSAIRCDQETRLRWEEEGRQRRARLGLGRSGPLRPEELEPMGGGGSGGGVEDTDSGSAAESYLPCNFFLLCLVTPEVVLTCGSPK
jgi:hypothetical protein